jgi:hypothetical protein
MRSVLAAVALLLLASLSAAVSAAAAQDCLPSRDLVFPRIAIPRVEPANFDLMDFRADQRRAVVVKRPDVAPHSMFAVKRHIGLAAGYDNGVHGSVGIYLTIAEWGRWNFGVPAAEVGLGRYRIFDRRLQRMVVRDEYTFIVSLASVHYRMKSIRSLGANAYLNFEQVYDLRHNLPGSQIGISFSSK